ncbi:MAG TPA: sigma-70 family RNA polymerase sigma factor [Solirubrobacterales bacterium]|nr:sigma-70 family RNA polymerase sigma factor [Solirubrobacterales bacterium]
MAANPRKRLSVPASGRRLSLAESSFYAGLYDSARRGSLAELRKTGCSEEEAEEFFQTAFERVMENVDPIEREFSAPQMVNFIKRTAWRCMIDERRRRGQRPEVEIGTVHSLSDMNAESPDEVAEEREAIAIGREALQMLSERDRLIFRQRHQMNLSPEEILQNMPGLSLRTYRKIIHRANTRVLEAFEKIEGGSRCEEMEGGLLRRYVAGRCPEPEELEIRAHLAHCRACRQTQARMRGYLLDVSGALVVATELPGSGRFAGLGELPSRLVDLAAGGAHGLGEMSRSARDRLREIVLRFAGGVPGAGGDATVSQALTVTSVKVASACAAGVAAGACIAAGVVPGVGGIGLRGQDDEGGRVPETRPPARIAPAAKPPALFDTLPKPSPRVEKKARGTRRSAIGGGGQSPASGTSSSRATQSESTASSPSEATESGSVTGSEFGAESGQPAAPEPPASSTPSGGSGSESAGGNRSIPRSGGSGEFGEL